MPVPNGRKTLPSEVNCVNMRSVNHWMSYNDSARCSFAEEAFLEYFLFNKHENFLAKLRCFSLRKISSFFL